MATTTIELDEGSYLSYPIAPASLWGLDFDVKVFDFHQLVHRDGTRLVFETFQAGAAPPPVGSGHRFCSWWVPHAIDAVRDVPAEWELRPYPGDGHSHCLLTWARISATDEETEGYFNSDHGWVTKEAFRECFAEDRLGIRRAWRSIEHDA
ncbi:MAG: hypothetical protein P4L84_28810 [Isosphaeraceae bacterium]|nr:hypothetical protein [Isosphaeraceae bacterium]